MRILKIIVTIFLLVLPVILASATLASEKEKEFTRIQQMDVKELTVAAQAGLDKKYPGEDWAKYKFPKYVYISNSVLAGYKIAVKESQLLAKIPCYCFCGEMGHKNLAHCFLKKGIPSGKYDNHASTCNVCYTEAMRAFLWKDLGASDEEILAGMKKVYGR